MGCNDDVVLAPRQVQALASERVTLIECGWKHGLAVTESGKLFTWGRNVNGQLGHGGTQDCNAPVLVPSLSAGGIDTAALAKAAQPQVMYSVAASDRYAVVPDSAPTDDGGGGQGGGAAVPDAKRLKS